MTTAILVVVLSLISTAVAVPLARRVAVRKSLLDVPNERSSHKIPTPRIGGAGIIAGATIGFCAGCLFSSITLEPLETMLLGVLILATTIGLLDDFFNLPTALRLLLYIGCAIAAASLGACTQQIQIPGIALLHIGYLGGIVFSSLFIAWYTNLFNFMDGIDGIAGGAATVTMGALAIVFMLNGETSWGLLALASSAASLGFLMYNFPPATVFMGDGGAVFLGLAAGMLSVKAVAMGHISLPAAVLLMFPFVFDATFTLFRRIIMRERFWAAHRSHVYQQLCDLGLTHRSITTIYTVAAVLFAGLGLMYNALPSFLRVFTWWCSIAVLFFLSVYVVAKNNKRAAEEAGK